VPKLSWTTEKRKIADLVPFPDNPRRLTEKQAVDLKKSLAKFDLVEIPAIDKDNKIIAGHQRLKLMVLDGRGEEVIDVRVPNRKLTDAEFLEYNLRSNKNTGEWDFDLLANWDEELLKDVGFDAELDKIFGGAVPEGADDVPEPRKETDIKLGDIFQLGKHRVMCGDSTDAAQVARLMDGKKADMVFTDPPYGIDIVKKDGRIGTTSNLGFVGAKGIASARQYQGIINDDTTESAKKSYQICKDLGIANYIIWGGNHFSDHLPHSRGWIVWDKKETDFKNTFADCELAWTSFDKPEKIYRHLWSGLLRKGERSEELAVRVHPTQKPVGLLREILEFYPKQQNILDLFLGSGSTLIACETINRICYGMEIDPVYVQVIIDRWEKLTGNKAVKIEKAT